MTAPKEYRLLVFTPINDEWFSTGVGRYKYCILFHKNVSIAAYTIGSDEKIKISSGKHIYDIYEALSSWKVVYDETFTVDN